MTTASARTTGTLFIVATPIGNREDLSTRALNTLLSVEIILAEDTRHSKPFLTSLGVKKPLLSLHAHNENNKSQLIIKMLLEGQSCALISDAGTPLIADPGFPLVRLARSHQIPVIPIPGPCALITALSAAGIACDTFTFYGFLPSKQTARRQKLASLRKIEHTLIFYESTHRILETIDDVSQVFGEECELVLAKELTKTFERFITGHCTTIKEWLSSNTDHLKGEFVLIIPPREPETTSDSPEQLLSILLRELPLKQAVNLAYKLSHVPKNKLYPTALRLSKEDHV